jgi:hypothetical protein
MTVRVHFGVLFAMQVQRLMAGVYLQASSIMQSQALDGAAAITPDDVFTSSPSLPFDESTAATAQAPIIANVAALTLAEPVPANGMIVIFSSCDCWLWILVYQLSIQHADIGAGVVYVDALLCYQLMSKASRCFTQRLT